MPNLNNFPTARQDNENSCWACAAREISNWYKLFDKSGRNPVYITDQELAIAWSCRTGNLRHADISVQQSASAALGDLGYLNNTDDKALPERQEICDSIESGRPLLAIVGGSAPNPDPNPDCQGGHWVVIVGISDDGSTIYVFDPDNGIINPIAYNSAIYQPGSYWQNTSYVDPQ